MNAAWPATPAPALPPAPWSTSLPAVALLTEPRPGTIEADSDQPCGWCAARINQGSHHTRPVHYKGVVYGSVLCAEMAYQGVPHIGTLPSLVQPAPTVDKALRGAR